jgi:hypothetical protein
MLLVRALPIAPLEETELRAGRKPKLLMRPLGAPLLRYAARLEFA